MLGCHSNRSAFVWINIDIYCIGVRTNGSYTIMFPLGNRDNKYVINT